MEIQQHDGVVVEAAEISAGLRQAQREGEVLRGEREAPGARVQLPCASPLYIGVEGAGFLPSKSIGALAKVGGKKSHHLISFPTDCYPPLLGILILSLRDMILFLLRGNLGAP